MSNGELGPWDRAEIEKNFDNFLYQNRFEERKSALLKSGDCEERVSGFKYNKKKLKFVIASSLCSIILTSVLIGYYENKPIVHQQAFSMAVICITGVFFVISLLSLRSMEVVEYNNRGLIIFFCLVIQIACIVLSVLVYCKNFNNFFDDDI